MPPVTDHCLTIWSPLKREGLSFFRLRLYIYEGMKDNLVEYVGVWELAIWMFVILTLYHTIDCRVLSIAKRPRATALDGSFAVAQWMLNVSSACPRSSGATGDV